LRVYNELPDESGQRQLHEPGDGYAQYIDPDQWVETSCQHHSLQRGWIRLSGYFYKDRNKRLEQGPLWDCDRCLGPAAPPRPRAIIAVSVRCTGVCPPAISVLTTAPISSVFRTSLFPGLSDSSAIQTSGRDSSTATSVRGTNEYSSNVVLAMIDGYYNEIKEAQVRDQARWAPSGFNYHAPPPNRQWLHF